MIGFILLVLFFKFACRKHKLKTDPYKGLDFVDSDERKVLLTEILPRKLYGEKYHDADIYTLMSGVADKEWKQSIISLIKNPIKEKKTYINCNPKNQYSNGI